VRIRTVTGLILGFALLFTTASPTFAQDPITVGVKAGLNVATLSISDEDNEESRTGLVLGVSFMKPIRARVGLQVEALYSQKGAKFSEEGFEDTIKLDYFEIPVLADFTAASNDRMSFHVLAGPSFGFNTKAEIKSEFEGEEETEDIGDDVKSADVGFIIGAAVRTGQLVFDARYNFGLLNILTSEAGGDEESVKTRTFSISVTWLIAR
jgi:hypothetical protein